MRFDIPYLPDGDYPAFLAERRDHLAAVHFSLNDPALADARHRMKTRPIEDMVTGLNMLGDTPKHVLLNARLHHPEAYFDGERLAAIAERLDFLVREAAIDGLVFTDLYFLHALSDAHPEVAEKLEAQPSINCILDSPERVFAVLDAISRTHFQPPTRVILDRRLNRNYAGLTTTVETVKRRCPDLAIYLMANEGCLIGCPFKLTHDAHIAMTVEGVCGNRTFAMNRDLGCIRRFLDFPGAFAASPFIRPEDVHRYDGLIDGIKLCGRTKGIEFLKRAVSAYLARSYPGNLLDIMDAMGDLSDRVSLRNDQLPDDFFDRVTTCDKACDACGWCAALAESVITRMDPGLERL